MSLIVLRRALEQAGIAQTEGDSAYFWQLLYFGELVVKIATVGMCAAISDDSDRHRYASLYRLVRSNGIGEWAQVLDEVINGPTSILLRPEIQSEKRELSTRVSSEAWQYRSISYLDAALRELDQHRQGMPAKIEGRLWFSYFAELRNATRGHGALSPFLCAKLSPPLAEAINMFVAGFSLFRREWVYLHKNLSGKYRVTPFGATSDLYQPLKSADPTKWGHLPDGTYFFAGSPIHVELLFTDPDLTDFYLPNGNFRDKEFEVLSYTTNAKRKQSGSPYLLPATQLPSSETQGCRNLSVSGDAFTNLPELPPGYVSRRNLEERLADLLTNDRHPVVSLVGRGGIGKTSLALKVLHQLTHSGRFAAILWFSARDVDLLPTGPKPVRAHLITETQLAKEFETLLEPLTNAGSALKPIEFLASSLTKSPLDRPILFVFDNFETTSNPVQVYTWLDTYIRNPNKLLITSRFREFKGDYPLEVAGMDEQETLELIATTSAHLGIAQLVTDQTRSDLYRESDGHPYIIKLLLGEIAKLRRVSPVERVVAAKDEVLNALFERSFLKLSPAAQLVFLTLASWRSAIPRIAVEAVMLRPANDRLDIESALTELEQSSFIDVLADPEDNQEFISVPLSAAVFGRKRIEVSPMKMSVEANKELLLFFGAGQRHELRGGVGPRIERFFKRVAIKMANGGGSLEEYLPILEYISRRYAPGWLYLAQILQERSVQEGGGGEEVLDAVRRFIEASDDDVEEKRKGWSFLVQIARAQGDLSTEVQGLLELASLPKAPFDLISDAANRLNNVSSRVQGVLLGTDERRLMARRLLRIAEERLQEADGTDLSRFAWLSLSLGDEDKARSLILQGLAKEPSNEYCARLKERLSI